MPTAEHRNDKVPFEVKLQDLRNEEDNLNNSAHHQNGDVRSVQKANWELGSLVTSTIALKSDLVTVILVPVDSDSHDQSVHEVEQVGPVRPKQ